MSVRNGDDLVRKPPAAGSSKIWPRVFDDGQCIIASGVVKDDGDYWKSRLAVGAVAFRGREPMDDASVNVVMHRRHEGVIFAKTIGEMHEFRIKWIGELTNFISATCGMETGSELHTLCTALPNSSLSIDDLCLSAARLRDGFGFPWVRAYDYGQLVGIFQKFRIAEDLVKSGCPADNWIPPLKVPAPFSHVKSTVEGKREVFIFSDSSL